MITRSKALADTAVYSLVDLFGDHGTFDNVIVQTVAGNSATLYAGDQGQQAVELPVGTIGYNFGGTKMSQVYVRGATGDVVTFVGINNG